MSTGAERAGAGAECFMICIHPGPDQDPSAIAGAIEHLGTGEKLFEHEDSPGPGV